MSRPTRLLRLVLCVALTLSFACGDDAKGTTPTPDAGSPMVDSGPQRPPRTDAGPIVGTGVEGGACVTAADCSEDLACVAYSQTLSVCARGCTNDSTCGTERCLTYTGELEDAHCTNTVREPFGLCGPTDTSVCAARTCLTFATGIGVCVDICAVGEDADGGVPDPLPDGIVECAPGQYCADGIVQQATGIEGVCVTRAARGEDCGLEQGMLCGEADVCAPSDATNLTSPTRCYQDCTERGTVCETGQCTDFRGQIAYCL